MKAGEFLNMPAVINMEIVCAKIELEHYKRLAEKMKNTLAENESTSRLIDEANENIKRQQSILHEKYMCLTKAEQEILRVVSALKDERIKTAIKYRYICLMKYEDIADKMNYCVRQVRRFLEKGTAEIEKIMENDEEKTG